MTWDVERHPDFDHVAVVTMNTNPVNAQGPAFHEDFHECFDRLEDTYPDCAVVLTSAGEPFSVGLDFDHLLPLFASRDHDAIDDWLDGHLATIRRLFTYPRPTVAAMDGDTYAGGLVLALACDYRVAIDEDADIAINEVAIGIPMPAVYVPLIRFGMGLPTGRVATLFGRVFTPEEALRGGIVDELAPAEAVRDRAVETVGAIHPDCHTAYAYSKRALQDRVLGEMERLAASQDAADFAAALSADGSLRAQARRYREVVGEEPHWEY